jgi:hypothetical protein
VSSDDDLSRAELATWHVYDVVGPDLSLKVRFQDGVELPDWQDGPDLLAAFEQAAAEGWHAFDRERGEAPGEYAIYHLKRVRRPHRTAR